MLCNLRAASSILSVVITAVQFSTKCFQPSSWYYPTSHPGTISSPRDHVRPARVFLSRLVCQRLRGFDIAELADFFGNGDTAAIAELPTIATEVTVDLCRYIDITVGTWSKVEAKALVIGIPGFALYAHQPGAQQHNVFHDRGRGGWGEDCQFLCYGC